MSFYEISDSCKKCGLCQKQCKAKAIVGDKKTHFDIDGSKCLKCGACYAACPFGCVSKDGVLGVPKAKRKTLSKAKIDREKCLGCRNCHMNCPNDVITFHKDVLWHSYCSVDQDKCVGCANCTIMCMNDCIVIETIEKK